MSKFNQVINTCKVYLVIKLNTVPKFVFYCHILGSSLFLGFPEMRGVIYSQISQIDRFLFFSDMMLIYFKTEEVTLN